MEPITHFAIFLACFASYIMTVQVLRKSKPTRASSHRMIGFSLMIAGGSYAAYFMPGWEDLANHYVIAVGLMLALANLEHILDMKKQAATDLVDQQYKDVA